MIMYSTYMRNMSELAVVPTQSYFCARTQIVQIDGIMSDFASLLCGLPQGSVLGPMNFFFLLPRCAILKTP